ncbi:MAG: hypothetical protein HZC23_15970 [Rhodocyclales bacterium]|nr:hypothetical protein [Rhodocyclales bacterium]
MPEPPILIPLRNLGSAPLRIEWFGDVAYAGRSGGRSPMVAVTLARGHQGQWIRTDIVDDSPLTASIPIAYLRLLRIGDIWVSGERVGTDPGSTRITFENLQIDDSTTSILPAGLPVAEDGGKPTYLLPFSDFDGHRGHTGAFCARVRLPDGGFLVVPCMELIRFYFGDSGLLLKRLFSGATATDNLYLSAWRSDVSGAAHLTLAPGLPFPAARTVARIVFDRQAAKAAAWIAKSGVTAAAHSERYYPKTTFPFKGQTNLTVEGRWLGGDERRVLLVERILQCSHPFPFQRLHVRTTTELAGDGPPGSSGRSKSSKRDAEPRRHKQELLEGFVTRALLPMAVVEDDIETPFPDLVGKPVHRMADNHAKVGSRTDDSENVGELSSGETSSGLGGRESEVTTSQARIAEWDSEPEVVALFLKAFDELVKEGRITAKLVPPLSTQGGTTPRSPFLRGDWIVPEPDGQSRQLWCAMIVESEVMTDRRFLVMAIATDPGKVALARFDAPPGTEDKSVTSHCAAFAEHGSLPERSDLVVLDPDQTRNRQLISGLFQSALRHSSTGDKETTQGSM